jgi:Tfp pilus assembly protein PilE
MRGQFMNFTQYFIRVVQVCALLVLLYGCSSAQPVEENPVVTKQAQDMEAYYAQQRAYYEQQRLNMAKQPPSEMTVSPQKSVSSVSVKKKLKSSKKRKKSRKKSRLGGSCVKRMICQ